MRAPWSFFGLTCAFLFLEPCVFLLVGPSIRPIVLSLSVGGTLRRRAVIIPVRDQVVVVLSGRVVTRS